jgi:hypothetical protein
MGTCKSGGFITAILFMAGKFLIGFIWESKLSSAYGTQVL